MRVRQLATLLGLPHRDVMDRIRRNLPDLPVDSVMSQLTEQDVDTIIVALATTSPRHAFEGTPYAEQARVALQFHERSAKMKARIQAKQPRELIETPTLQPLERVAEPAQRWATFMLLLDALHDAESTTQHRDARELVARDGMTCSACAEHGTFAQVMARRRLAISHLSQRFLEFSEVVIKSIVLLELNETMHQAIRQADARALATLYPPVREFLSAALDQHDDHAHDASRAHPCDLTVTHGLTREQVRAQMRARDTWADELAVMHGHEEINGVHLTRITSWFGGEEEPDYPWLRTILNEDHATYSAALALELRRADDLMLRATLAHVFGEGDEVMSVRFIDEGGPQHVMVYVGQGGVAGAWVSRDV